MFPMGRAILKMDVVIHEKWYFSSSETKKYNK